VDANVATLMTAFNDNDGIPASANDFLLKKILREEWNFNGMVVSDWASMSEMIAHGFAGDEKEVALLSANAGVDMEMVSETYGKNLETLVAKGLLAESVINNAVRNILRLKFRLGLFQNPYTQSGKSAYSEKHLQKAYQTAVESAVLLKNNRLLPLNQTQKIAIIGPMADAPHDQLGTWVFDGEKSHTVTPLKALQTEYKNVKYIYEPALKYTRDTNTSDFKKVIKAVKVADIAVVFVGEESILSGEAHSLADINLIGAQSDLLKTIKSAGKPVVVVVMAGRPLTIEQNLPFADALLYCFHPGTMGGPAIMDLLFGKQNPNGKLPVTFPRHVGQIPVYYNHNNTGRPAPDDHIRLNDIPVEANQSSLGNTSFYLDYGKEPLFPFGYGLSYSEFRYSNMELSSSGIGMQDTLTVKVSVSNTSNVAGKEVVQLYISDKAGSIARPVKELKAFRKIEITAGESKEVEFRLTSGDFAFYGKDMVKKAEPGEFDIWVGGNSADGLKKSFVLK
jgi:beta-glucosidase